MDRTEKPAIITRMAECLHHGEILVASVDVSIMICPLQFLTSIPGFQSFSQKAAMARSRHLPRRLRLTLTLEWKAQLQRPFPMPLCIEIPHACQQEIIQRNHSHQFSA